MYKKIKQWWTGDVTVTSPSKNTVITNISGIDVVEYNNVNSLKLYPYTWLTSGDTTWQQIPGGYLPVNVSMGELESMSDEKKLRIITELLATGLIKDIHVDSLIKAFGLPDTTELPKEVAEFVQEQESLFKKADDNG